MCYREQRTATEDTANTDQQSQEWKVLLPAGTAVDGHDLITVGSLVLEVIGPPWPGTEPAHTVGVARWRTARMVA